MTKVGAGLFGASGAAAYISPKGNFKAYDMDVTEASALSVMRCVGAAPAAYSTGYGARRRCFSSNVCDLRLRFSLYAHSTE